MTVQFYLLLKRTASSQNVHDFEVLNKTRTHAHTHTHTTYQYAANGLKMFKRYCVISKYKNGTTSVAFQHSLHDLYEQNKQN